MKEKADVIGLAFISHKNRKAHLRTKMVLKASDNHVAEIKWFLIFSWRSSSVHKKSEVRKNC